MDIDGVILRGSRVISGAVEAVRKLREAGVPYVFMTNGGGVTEAAKASQLARWLEDPSIDETNVLLSHTPMRSLASTFEGKRVVIAGSGDTPAVAESYGFDFASGWAITPSQIAMGTPGISSRPFRPLESLPPVDVNADGIPIEAILIFHHPVDWCMELQVLTDVLAGGVPLGVGLPRDPGSPMPQAAQLFVSNPDFVWQAAYPVPRYGQAAFVDSLRVLWHRFSEGSHLRVTEFGKPHKSQFAIASEMCSPGRASLRRIYMIGDNPEADIRGANAAGDPWRSVLLCTGVYKGGVDGNDPKDPAWRVEKDLHVAVERLLDMSDEEHLRN